MAASTLTKFTAIDMSFGTSLPLVSSQSTPDVSWRYAVQQISTEYPFNHKPRSEYMIAHEDRIQAVVQSYEPPGHDVPQSEPQQTGCSANAAGISIAKRTKTRTFVRIERFFM